MAKIHKAYWDYNSRVRPKPLVELIIVLSFENRMTKPLNIDLSLIFVLKLINLLNRKKLLCIAVLS